MPYCDPPQMPGLGTPLEDLLRRIERIEARMNNLQNSSIVATDTTGKVRMVIGALDGPPATKWGVQIFDPSGNEEVRLGQLDGTPAIYGLAVRPFGGSTLQQVGGSLYGAQTSVTGVTAVNYTAFSPTDGHVTAEIGPSGLAYVSLNGRVSTGGSAEVGRIAVDIDGSVIGGTGDGAYPFISVSESVGAGGVSVSAAATFVAVGLSQGTHTFKPCYRTANDGASNCNFTNVQLVVQPL